MNDTLLDLTGKMPLGWNPPQDRAANSFWEVAENVEFRGQTIYSSGKHELLLFLGDEPIRGFGAIRTVAGVQELYFGTLSGLFRSVAGSAPIPVGTGYTMQEFEHATSYASHWQFVNWGEWMLVSNGREPVQVRKGSGDFTTLLEDGATAVPFLYAKLMAKLGPHLVVANTSNAQNEIRWCSDDNIEKWTVLDSNTAGDFIVRDADSGLMAMKPLGAVLALYTREAMWVMTYIGAPFVFGVTQALDGVGAFGPCAVASVGKYNYGWGPMGIWQTDGTSFTLIDSAIREYIAETLEVRQASQIVAFHDEVRRRVVFSFPSAQNTGNSKTICYDYSSNTWSTENFPVTAALERGVFQWPLVAEANTASVYNVSTDGQLMYLRTFPLHFGDVTSDKFLSQIRIAHTGTIQLQYAFSDTSAGPFTVSAPVALPTDMEFVGIDTAGKYWQFHISAPEDASINGITFYGRSGGRRI